MTIDQLTTVDGRHWQRYDSDVRDIRERNPGYAFEGFVVVLSGDRRVFVPLHNVAIVNYN